MPRAWFLGLFSVVVWTVFLLMERVLPEAPAALLLPLVLAAGLAAAFLDHRFSLPVSQRCWQDHALFALVCAGFGGLYGASLAPWFSGWFSGVLVEPQTSLSSFMRDGPALLIFLEVIVNTAHRRRMAPSHSNSVFTAKSTSEGLLGLGAGALAWSWLPVLLGPASQPIYVYAFVAGNFAMTVFAWFVPYVRGSMPPAPAGQT